MYSLHTQNVSDLIALKEIARITKERAAAHKRLVKELTQLAPESARAWLEETGVVESLLENGRWMGSAYVGQAGFSTEAILVDQMGKLEKAWEEEVVVSTSPKSGGLSVSFFPKVPA